MEKSKKMLLEELKGGLNIDKSSMTVSEWLNIWQNEFCINLQASTACRYGVDIRLRIISALGSIKSKNLKAEDFQRLYNASLQSRLSEKSVKKLASTLHKALEQALKLGYIIRNECDSCVIPNVDKKEMHPLTDDMLPLFIKKIKWHPFEDLYLVTLFTGMRQGEILGLTWNNIDFRNGQILVCQQLQRQKVLHGKGEYILKRTKTGKERIVSPAPYVMNILRRIKTEQDAMKNNGSFHNEMNLVFVDEAGNHLVERTILRNLNCIVKEIGHPKVRFHDLRHTFATIAIQNGDDIKTVSANLGHATTSFTMDVCGHASNKMRTESAGRIVVWPQSCGHTKSVVE